jgi:hypothetical protein
MSDARSGLYMAHGLPPIVVQGDQTHARDMLLAASRGSALAHFTLATEPGHIYVNPAHVVCVVAAREQTDDEQRAARAPRISIAR